MIKSTAASQQLATKTKQMQPSNQRSTAATQQVATLRCVGKSLIPDEPSQALPGRSSVGPYFSRMLISSPGTQIFPGNSNFQLSLKCSPISSRSREHGTRVIFLRGRTFSSPGGPRITLSTSIRCVQASGHSFSVVFTPHSSDQGCT